MLIFKVMLFKGVSLNHILIAGLGNPGAEYYYTRHNLGALLVEKLSGVPISDFKDHSKSQCLYFTKQQGQLKVHYVLPQGYMNRSGYCLYQYAHYFKIKKNDIIACYDDLSLECGDFRLRVSGGDGGHNGIKDCISHFASQDIVRLRLGISHPGIKDQVHSYVLKPFTAEQEQVVEKSLETIVQNQSLILEKQWSKFQNTLH